MVYRLQLTYDEAIDILDVKCIALSTIGCTLPPSVYQISDINVILKLLLPGNVEAYIIIDVIGLKSTLNDNKKQLSLLKNLFGYTLLGFTESYTGVLGKFSVFI